MPSTLSFGLFRMASTDFIYCYQLFYISTRPPPLDLFRSKPLCHGNCFGCIVISPRQRRLSGCFADFIVINVEPSQRVWFRFPRCRAGHSYAFAQRLAHFLLVRHDGNALACCLLSSMLKPVWFIFCFGVCVFLLYQFRASRQVKTHQTKTQNM